MSAALKKFRSAPRREINSERAKITIDSLSSLENLEKFAKDGQIIEASSTGILLKIKRSDFVSKQLKSNLNIDCLVGKPVFFNIHEMNLEISGVVARTQFIGDGCFTVAIDYREDAEEYWRECLMDMLPTKNYSSKN